MNLEELITTKLRTALAGTVATFGGQPAVFEGPAPLDVKWEATQFPRLHYVLDRTADPARKVSGTGVFEIFCGVESSTLPDDVAVAVRYALDGSVFHPAGEPVTAFLWSAQQGFTEQENIQGVVVQFDLIAFPAQGTFDPDPVAAMVAWTAGMFPELDVDPTTWGGIKPAVYWRYSGVTVVRRDPGVLWLDAGLACHIISGDISARLEWMRRIIEAIGIAGEIPYDSATMIPQRVAGNSGADPFREGQIQTTIRYGVIPARTTYTTLEHATITGALP